MSRPIPLPAELPARMPQYPDGLQRRVCRLVLRLCGWHLAGQFPDFPKAVLIAAPHSSWWDGVWGLLMKVAVGAEIHGLEEAVPERLVTGQVIHALLLEHQEAP